MDKECQLANVVCFLASSYNLESSIWNVGAVSRGPLQRYGHSLALYQVGLLLTDIPVVLRICVREIIDLRFVSSTP